MRRIGGLMAAVLLLAVPVAAQAGFTMGARFGLGFPGGEAFDGGDIDEVVARSNSFMFHLGGAFAQNHASIEGFLEVSPMTLDSQLEEDCDFYGDSCAAVGMRVGVMGTFRFAPQQFLSPWVGGGLGWEMLYADFDYYTYTFTGTTFELMGGVDFKAGPVFSWGPYASMQFGTYTDATYWDDAGGSVDFDPDAGMHTWFQIGIRGKFDFGGGGGGGGYGGGYAPGPGY